MRKENDMNKLGNVYNKSVKDDQREIDISRLDYGEKHQWKVNIPTSDDIKDINNLV